MSADKYRSYKRIHRYSHPVDVEEGKIKTEMSDYVRQTKKNERLLERRLREYEPDEVDEDVAEIELRAKKQLHNAKGHKRRLKELERREDF